MLHWYLIYLWSDQVAESIVFEVCRGEGVLFVCQYEVHEAWIEARYVSERWEQREVRSLGTLFTIYHLLRKIKLSPHSSTHSFIRPSSDYLLPSFVHFNCILRTPVTLPLWFMRKLGIFSWLCENLVLFLNDHLSVYHWMVYVICSFYRPLILLRFS